MRNEANTYDYNNKTLTPFEWGDKFKATMKTFSNGNSDLDTHVLNFLKRLPECRKMNINSFGFVTQIDRIKFIHTLMRVSVINEIEITTNYEYNDLTTQKEDLTTKFQFYKNTI